MTAPLPDDPPPERPIYRRGTPEFHVAWLQVIAQRKRAKKEYERRGYAANRAVVIAQSAASRRAVIVKTLRADRAHAQEQRFTSDDPEQRAERLRILAERRARASAYHKQRQAARRALLKQKDAPEEQAL